MSRQGEKDILQQLEARRERIVALSRRIHSEPETAFEEHKTSRLLQEVLARQATSNGTAENPRTCAGRALWTFLVPGAAARVYWKGDHGAYRPFSAQ